MGHALPNPLVVVAAALVDGDGRVLMQQRPAGREHGGLWEFPGGKCEAGEAALAALVRELAEELAITVDPADCFPLGFSTTPPGSPTRPIVLLLYGCRRWQGVVQSLEGAALGWHDPAALDTLPMPPLDIPLVALARTFTLAKADTPP
jgi:8-oxo-dGTP diphosphatase